MNQIDLDIARLLTQVAPLVFMDDTLALQGGTVRRSESIVEIDFLRHGLRHASGLELHETSTRVHACLA